MDIPYIRMDSRERQKDRLIDYIYLWTILYINLCTILIYTNGLSSYILMD
jgi:hypothetical protein